MVELTLKGTEILVAKYKRFPGQDVLIRTIDTYVAQMQLALREYPPVPAGSRYQRTFRLRGGWQHVRGPGSVGRLVNRVPYAQYVQGQRQRRFHRARGWQTTDDVLRVYGPRVTASARRQLQDWINS
jgi:hypothetical protein